MKELRLEYPDDLQPVTIDLRIKPGDRVSPGDLIAEVSTDKATQELEAFESFTLRDIQPTARGYLLLIEPAE